MTTEGHAAAFGGAHALKPHHVTWLATEEGKLFEAYEILLLKAVMGRIALGAAAARAVAEGEPDPVEDMQRTAERAAEDARERFLDKMGA
jgi:hypothetical protein